MADTTGEINLVTKLADDSHEVVVIADGVLPHEVKDLCNALEKASVRFKIEQSCAAKSGIVNPRPDNTASALTFIGNAFSSGGMNVVYKIMVLQEDQGKANAVLLKYNGISGASTNAGQAINAEGELGHCKECGLVSPCVNGVCPACGGEIVAGEQPEENSSANVRSGDAALKEPSLPENKFKVPVGIGGWLLIPFYLLIVGIYLNGREVLNYFSALFSTDFWYYFASDYNTYNPTYGLLVIGETFASVIFMAWSALCVYLILKKSSLVRKACSRYFFAVFAYMVIDAIIASVCIPDYQIFPEGSGTITVLASWAGRILLAVYFLKSKRVENTFCSPSRKAATIEKSLSPVAEEEVSKVLFRRFAARVVDVVTVIALAHVIIKLCEVESSIVFLPMMWVKFCLVFDVIIYILFGQTLGKALLGLRVVGQDGKPLSRKEYIFRSGNALFYLGWPLFALFFHCPMSIFWALCIVSVIVTFGYQYCKVLSTGSTSYDAVYDIKVVFKGKP